MKKFIIGDTHGCYSEFKELLDSLPIDFKKDQLIMLGDYIDRGPESYEIIQFIKSLREQYGPEHIILLRGNHEQMAIDSFENGSNQWFNGYNATLKSFSKNNYSLSQAVEFFSTLPLFHEDDDFIYVHGGIRPGTSMNLQLKEDLLWIREDFIYSSKPLLKTVIFGHTPTMHINNSTNPVFLNHKIAIDTGCVFGYALTALEIIDGKISNTYQVSYKAA
ncbi:MAG: serine/threonine protein phosphatase [Clostridiales bacterium]|nr:serine/threonine protein phosphatase [Clostridiales bacterium]